jgi:hypothetical protein
LTALNGLTAQVQFFAVGTSGTDFNIASATATHTFNLPTASSTNRGALSSADWSMFNAKQNALTLTTTGNSGASSLIGATLNVPTYTLAGLGGIGGTIATGHVAFGTAANTIGGGNNLFWDNTNGRLGVGITTPSSRVEVAQTSTGNLDYLTIYNTGGGAVNDQTALSFEHGGNRRSSKMFSTLESSTSTAIGFVTTASSVEAERWRITSTGILQSNGAQTIQTSTGNLTLATAAGNGNIVLSPNGTGRVQVGLSGTAYAKLQTVANTAGAIPALGTTNDSVALAISTQAISYGLLSGVLIDGNVWMQSQRFAGAADAFNLLLQPSGGNVLIGITTNAGFRLDVNGSTRFNGLSTIQGTTASDSGQLGAELLTTGTGDASWTGTSFATGYTHVAGSTTTLTSTLAGVVNTFYQITYTVTGRTAGSFTIAFGGESFAGLTATGAVGPQATTTGTLVITPTSDFNGTIVLSIRVITASSASVTFNDSTGVVRGGIRASSRGMFIGTNSGRINTTGVNNSAFLGLSNNTTGIENSAFGNNSLLNNSIGSFNSAFGQAALQSNRSGNRNIAFGAYSLFANVTGSNNQVFGVEALTNNTANNNQAFGSNSLQFNTTGSNNIAIGHFSGRSIADGVTANTITNNSVYIGALTRPLADNQTNQIVIGNQAIGLGSNTTVLGNTSTTHGRWYGSLLLGTTTNAASSILTMDSTTQGFLPPRMTSTQRNAIASPATGLIVYDTTLNDPFYFNGTAWTMLQDTITLTTTGSSGAATLVGTTLNIPQYQAAGTYVTSVTASSPLASSGGTTPNITIQQASGSQNGFLSSTDWTTFNSKQNALTNPVTGTGTSGQVAYWSSGSAITGESNLFWDATNDRLSIGTASANSKLTVNGSENTDIFTILAGNNSRLHIGTATSGTIAYLRSQNNYALNLGVNSSDYLSIFNTGRVFIGSSPSDSGFTLDVNGTGRFSGALTGTSASFTANVGINSSTVNERLVVTQTTNNTSSVGFYTNASIGTSFGPIILAGTNSSDAALRVFNQAGTSPYLFVRGDGNLGIGTDTPNAKLHIVNSLGGTTPSNYLQIEGSITDNSNYPSILFKGGTLATTYPNISLSNGGLALNLNQGFSTSFTNTSQISLNNGTITLSTGTSPSARFSINSSGGVILNSLSGSGNRIVVANSSGTLISAVIGSGLAFDGTTLTATGGGSGSISGSGTSGIIALFTGSTSIGNSAISQSGSNITVTGDIRSNAIYRDYQGEALIQTSGSDTQIGTFGAGTPRTISLLAGNDRRLFITTGGRVLIGTTSDNGALFRILGPNGLGTFFDAQNDGAGGATFARIGNSFPFNQYTFANGNVIVGGSVTATSFFESSDATLKTLVQDDYQAKGIDSVVAKLYIKNGKQELGYFAQDLQGILPSAVNKGSDGLLNLSYREVHTAKIASLENRIKELESQLKNN